jgi:endogenous inhibitor of DNA gyrase (YacG/DUF329 family)
LKDLKGKQQYKQINCPNCGKQNTWTEQNSFRPFCSERCKLIDLGGWASEKYSVPGEKINTEEIDPDKPDDKDKL